MAYRYRNLVVSNQILLMVWQKGIVVPGYNGAIYRKDVAGNWMQFDKHGEEGKYGWEIDHVFPVVLGGGDNIGNLQPLYWRNNRIKGDSWPWYPSSVHSR